MEVVATFFITSVAQNQTKHVDNETVAKTIPGRTEKKYHFKFAFSNECGGVRTIQD